MNQSPGKHHLLACLYFTNSFCRTILLSLIPLLALDWFGNPQRVSLFYFGVSLFGILASLSIPALSRKLAAHGTMLVGVGLIIVSCLLIPANNVWIFLIGMVVHIYAMAALDISMTLLQLQRVERNDMAVFEPKRVIFGASAYIIGPWLGVYLHTNHSEYWPYLLGIISSLVSVILMFAGKFQRDSAALQTPAVNTSLIRNLWRFSSQSRMRLAWILTLGRASWWGMFFIYTPLFAVTYGLSETTGAMIVSIGVTMVLTVQLWGRFGRRHGYRNMMLGSYLATALCMFLVGWLHEPAWLGATILIVAAIAVTPLDAVGNLPFLKFVRRRERMEMTGVFQTYRDMSQLAPPGIFALVLAVAPLPGVFVTSGIGLLILAAISRRLPRRF